MKKDSNKPKVKIESTVDKRPNGKHITQYTIHINGKPAYFLYFRPASGYFSFGWTEYSGSYRNYSGKKKMMADFKKHLKDHYGKK